jgi:hypothetical protein
MTDAVQKAPLNVQCRWGLNANYYPEQRALNLWRQIHSRTYGAPRLEACKELKFVSVHRGVKIISNHSYRLFVLSYQVI